MFLKKVKEGEKKEGVEREGNKENRGKMEVKN